MRTTFRELVEPVERPVTLEPDRKYRLLNAKRGRGGIVLRGEAFGREVLTKAQFEVKEGDFVISRRQIIHGACGVVPKALDGAVVSGEYSVLRPRTGLVPEFLRQYSHTPYFQRTCFHSSHGVDVEKMVFKLDRWLSWPVDVPPPAEQRKIVAILSSVDEAIEATQAVISRLKVVKEALIAKLIKFGPRDRPGSWTSIPLLEAGRWLSGGTPSKQNAGLWAGRIPWVSPKDMKRARLVDAEDHVGEAALGNGTQLAPVGSLLMVVRGMILAHSFPVALAVAPMAFNQDVKALVPTSTFEPEFLLYWLQASRDDVLRLVDVANHGTKRLPSERLFGLRVPCPPREEQAEVCGIIRSVDSRLEAETRDLAARTEAKNALLAALLTGQLRVIDRTAAA